MRRQLDRIRKAYDHTVDQHNKGIEPHVQLPEEFINSSDYKMFKENVGSSCGSSSPDIKEWLQPKLGMQFLDVGCCANLANYRLDLWPSIYYGVDISPDLIASMKKFVAHEHLVIGGLWVADSSEFPFENSFFDIAAVIGVLEYYDLDYIKKALRELYRVMKPQAKMVLDIPNPDHPHVNTMYQLEKYLGRPNVLKSRLSVEEILLSSFCIEHTDDSRVMIKYFVRRSK